MNETRFEPYGMSGRAASSQPVNDDDAYSPSPSPASSSSSASSSSMDSDAPLHAAVQNRDLESVRLLLPKLGVDSINQRRSSDGATVLWIAAHNNDVEMANLLLTVPGIDVDKGIRKKGYSPLRFAVQAQNISMVALLLRNEADPDLMAGDGSSPFRIAVTEDFIPLIPMLSIHRKSKPEPTQRASFIFSAPDTLFNDDKRYRAHTEELPPERLTSLEAHKSREEILLILEKHSSEMICPELIENIDNLIEQIQGDDVDSHKALTEIAHRSDAVNILNALHQYYNVIKAQGLSAFTILMIASQPDGAMSLHKEATEGTTLRELSDFSIEAASSSSSSSSEAASSSSSSSSEAASSSSSSSSGSTSSSSASRYTFYSPAPDISGTEEVRESDCWTIYNGGSDWTPFGWDNLSLG